MLRSQLKQLVGLSASIAVAGSLIACSGGKNQTTIELITDMMDQPSLKSQDYDEARDTTANMVPPDGAVARNHPPYRYEGDPLQAEAKLVNPYANSSDEKFQKLGEEKFRIYCSVCHGLQGKGDGQIAPYMALRPPSLMSDKVRGFKDGRIFHIITDGQGVMGSYATQIQDPDARWAVVNYIRSLQKKQE